MDKTTKDLHPTFCCPYVETLPWGNLNKLVRSEDKEIIIPLKPVQQDNYCKKFYMSIINGSLKSTFNKYGPSIRSGGKKLNGTKSVVIVGAGVSGLAAAFELQKEGYNTQIVELQHRVGGRTKTLRSGFSDGLHAEGGAMRIPDDHYCTNGYIQKFNIKKRFF